jgi:hypothetical protein
MFRLQQKTHVQGDPRLLVLVAMRAGGEVKMNYNKYLIAMKSVISV